MGKPSNSFVRKKEKKKKKNHKNPKIRKTLFICENMTWKIIKKHESEHLK